MVAGAGRLARGLPRGPRTRRPRSPAPRARGSPASPSTPVPQAGRGAVPAPPRRPRRGQHRLGPARARPGRLGVLEDGRPRGGDRLPRRGEPPARRRPHGRARGLRAVPEVAAAVDAWRALVALDAGGWYLREGMEAEAGPAGARRRPRAPGAPSTSLARDPPQDARIRVAGGRRPIGTTARSPRRRSRDLARAAGSRRATGRGPAGQLAPLRRVPPAMPAGVLAAGSCPRGEPGGRMLIHGAKPTGGAP